MIWFRYALKKFFYTTILKEEIQHPRWIKTKTPIVEQKEVRHPNIVKVFSYEESKKINIDRMPVNEDELMVTESDTPKTDPKK